MFLDEKLEKIYSETEGNEIERSNRLIKALGTGYRRISTLTEPFRTF